MTAGQKKERMLENIEIKELVSLKNLNHFETIPDPSNLFMSVTGTVFDLCWLGLDEKSSVWLTRCQESLKIYQNRGMTSSTYDLMWIEYLRPFLWGWLTGNPEWGLFKRFNEAHEAWAKEENGEGDKDSNVNRIVYRIVDGNVKESILKDFEEQKVGPFGIHLLKILREGSNEKNLKDLKSKIVRKIGEWPISHEYAFFWVYLLFKFRGQEMTKEDYFGFLTENFLAD